MTEKLRIRTTEDNVSQAIVTVVLERNTAYHLANTVLQIAILLMISFMSFYFDFDNFSDRIMMTLTTMLVITTILSSIQEVSILEAKYHIDFFLCQVKDHEQPIIGEENFLNGKENSFYPKKLSYRNYFSVIFCQNLPKVRNNMCIFKVL